MLAGNKCKWSAVFCWGVLAAALTGVGLARADIPIGRVGSLVSPVTQEATRLVGEGFDAYIAKVNAAGGVHGERIKVVFREDQYQAEPALAAARELIDKERAVALVNTIGSLAPSAMAKDGVLKRNDVALIGPVVGAPAVLSGANTFPIRADYDAEFALMTRHIEQMRWERVAYLHFNIGVAPGYAKYIADQAKSRGLSFTGAQGFDVVADPAVQAGLIKDAIAKLMEGKPQAVIVFSAGASQAVAMKALKEQGVQRYTISVNTASGLVKGLGQEDARGIIITQAVPAPAGVTRRVTAEYLRDLRQFSPHATPNYYSMEGYLTARVLTEALRRAGPKPSSASVLRALNGMGRYDMGDFAVDYGPTRKKVDFTLDITAIGRDGNLVR